MSKTILNDGSKTLFLDLSYLQNVLFKDSIPQLDLIVEKMGISGVHSFQEFQNTLRNSMIKSAFICLIDDKTRQVVKKTSNQEVYDAIIRVEFNTDTQRRLPNNTFLGFFVNINPKIPYLTVTSIFQTRLKPIVQDFETTIQECNLQIINYQNQIDAAEVIRRGIINSETIGLIGKLQSNFDAEKTKWLNYLDFSTDLLNLKRKNSLPYLNTKILQLIKVDEKQIDSSWKEKAEKFGKNLSHCYFAQNFEKYFAKEEINYELVDVIILDVLVDNYDKLDRIKKNSELALVPFSTNKLFPAIANLQKNINEIFNFNFERTRDSANFINLKSLLAVAPQNQSLQDFWLQKNDLIFGGRKEFEGIQSEFSQELNEWKVCKMLYEVDGTLERELFTEPFNTEKLANGYLAFVGVGEDVLIDRCRQVLKRIGEGNVKNPYLVNYLFNTKLVKLADSTNDVNIDDEDFLYKLNFEQKEAVKKALNSKDLFILQGPPGTGKTQVICEIVYQLSKLDRKILVSSQNHEAINNVMNRLPFEPNINRVRLVNQINPKSKEKNNFSPERVVYNYYKSIAKTLFTDLAVEDSQIKELNEIENKLEHLLLANRGYHQNNNQLRTLAEKINLLDTNIAEIKSSTITTFNMRKTLENEIFNLNNLIKELQSLDFYSAVEITPSMVAVYDNSVKVLMDEFTLNNLNKTIDSKNFYTDLKNIVKKIILDDPTYIACKKAETNILQFKKQAEFKLAEDEEEILQAHLKMLEKNLVYVELKVLLSQLAQAFLNLRVDLEYQLAQSANPENNDINITSFEVQKNELLITKKQLENNLGKSGQDLRDLLKYINKKFDLNLQSTDIDLEVKVKAELNKLQQQLKENLKRKQDFKTIFSNLKNYLEDNYKIIDNWNEEVPTNNFSNQMILESKKYTSNLLDKLVNIYGMTLTSTNLFKFNDDTYAKKLGLEEISLKMMDVDVVIVDEASKATVIEILMPLIYGKSLILVGDYRQLPPILKLQQSDVDFVNEQNEKDYSYTEMFQLLDQSIFKQLIGANNQSLTTMLRTQYRSHQQIMDIVNKFYDNELKVEAAVSEQKNHNLTVITNSGAEIIKPTCSAYWVDSSFDENGEIHFEKSLESSTSLFNELEIKTTVALMKNLDASLADKFGEQKPSLAVISFYGLHVNKLKKELKKQKFKNFEYVISTVDDFQGKEADYVIVNLVRNPKGLSNTSGREFLKKYERINVAFSRARELLIIIGAQRAVNDITVQIPTVSDVNVSNSRQVYADIIAKIDFENGFLKASDII